MAPPAEELSTLLRWTYAIAIDNSGFAGWSPKTALLATLFFAHRNEKYTTIMSGSCACKLTRIEQPVRDNDTLDLEIYLNER